MANETAAFPMRAGAFNFRPLLLLVGIAASVAVGVAVMLWWQGPNWTLLYGNLEAGDASQVVQALQTAGIKYKLNDSNGAVMVPSEQLHDARLKLAAQGLPESSSSSMDRINKESGLGVSQFMETARYQSALESDLARTIGALRNVVAARVHLAMSRESAFVRDHRPATASVLLQLRPGGRLEPEEVQAIVHLIASSIPDLSAEQVTIVDQQGRLLSAPGSAQSIAESERFAAAQRVGESYAQHIEALIVPLVGAGRVHAQVSADLDTLEAEETHEQYKPDSAVVRSEQTAETVGPAVGAAAGGVPGALTNQPPAGGSIATPPAPAAAAKPATGAAAAAAANAAPSATPPATPENVSKQATRSFEIDRTLSYTKKPGGHIKRLTVAVLIDNVPKAAEGGKTTVEPLSAAQIEDVTRLVKNAVGFDESRGDSVSVVNAPFHEEISDLKPEPIPIWQRPMVQDVARLGLGAAVLLALALGVLRPMVRSLTVQTLTAPPMGANGQGMLGEFQGAAPPSPLAYEQQVVHARSLVAQDPKRVAQVVRTWVGE
jgi:flagellar M-ring protein FliF